LRPITEAAACCDRSALNGSRLIGREQAREFCLKSLDRAGAAGGSSGSIVRAEVAAPGLRVKRANCSPSMRIGVA